MVALSEHFRVVTLDHRGHGDGIRSQDPFTLEDCADDAVALCDVLGVRRATFVGYSMGGPIAQLVWHRHPERVSGLVLCATAAVFSTTPPQRLMALTVEEMLRVSRCLLPPAVRRQAAHSLLVPLITDDAVRTDIVDALDRHDAGAIRQAGRELLEFDSTDWIGEISVPVAVVVTERDRLVAPSSQLALAEAIPGAEVIPVDGAHLAAFTEPDDVAAALADACHHIVGRASVPRRSVRRWLKRHLARARPSPIAGALPQELKLAASNNC